MPFADLLGRLAMPMEGRAGRISSNEQPDWNNANFDMTYIEAGTTFELPTIEGPAVINHIWLTSHAGHSDTLDQLVLRIYWDGSDEPAVEAPLDSFFACGHGKKLVVDSLPVQVSESGSLTCYWRMPFRRSCRITVANEHPTTTVGLYWQVDYLSLPVAEDQPYFHALYRQEYPCRSGADYLILETEGRGQYVGTVMGITMMQDGWYGEGDDFFYIDGEEIPSLQGTGSEDYFNDAWGFRVRTTAFFGQPLWEGYDAGDRGVAYRWHVADPVPFAKSLKLTIEHKGNMEPPTEGWYVERPDFYSSVAFWYQTGTPSPREPLPSYADRQLPWRSIAATDQYDALTATGGERSVQWLGARPVVFWQNEDPAGEIAMPFSLDAPLRCAAKLSVATSYDYGVFDVYLDDVPVARAVDLYSADTGLREVSFGTRELAAGAHTLTLKCRGANPAVARGASGGPLCYLGLGALRLLELQPAVMRPMGRRGREERHWIWRGITDGVRAFRATRRRAPASLAEIVEAGLLGKRYLTDENHQPLESWLEDGKLVVTSIGMDGVKGTADDWRKEW